MVYTLDGNYTNTIDWESAYNELRPAELRNWIKTHGFDIIQDFNKQNEDSFIRNVEDKGILEHIRHLRFLPSFRFSKRHDSEGYYGPDDEESYDSVEESYDSVEEESYDSSEEESYDSGDEETCGFVDEEFYDSDYEEYYDSDDEESCDSDDEESYDSIDEESYDSGNEEFGTSINPWYGKHNFKKILEALQIIKEKCSNIKTIEIVYNTSCVNTKKDDTRFGLFIEWLQSFERMKKVDFVVVGFEGIYKFDPILNRLPKRLTSLNIALPESIKSYKTQRDQVSSNLNNGISHYLGGSDYLKQVCSNGNIMPLLNIETLKIEIDVFAHEYLIQKFPNVKNLTISGKYAQQELVLAYEDIKDSFLPFLCKIPKYNIQSLCINNMGLDLMMKDFVEKQEANVIYCLDVMYTNDHNCDNTSVSISKSRSESDGGKIVISCYLYQNEKQMSNVENLLVILGPHLTKLSIDLQNISSGLSFDLERIYVNCNKLYSLKMALPEYRYNALATNSSSQNTLIQYGNCLSNISELDINNICISNERFDSIMKPFAEIQDNIIHHLNLIYTDDCISDHTSINICKKTLGSDNDKKFISYGVYQNKKHMNNLEKLLALFGPHLTKLSIYFKDLHESFSLDKEVFMNSIYSNCHYLKDLEIKAPPNFCIPTVPVKTRQPSLELSNFIASYLAEIPDLVIDNFYNISDGDSAILEIFAEKEKNETASPNLRLFYTFLNEKHRDQNSVRIVKDSQLGDDKSNTTFHVSLSPTSCSTDKVLHTLGLSTALLDIAISSCPGPDGNDYILSYLHNQRKPGYLKYYLSYIFQILEKNNSLSHGQNIELQNNLKINYFSKNGLKILKDWAKEEEEGSVSHYLNLVYCDGKNKDLNSIRVTKMIYPGQSEDDSKSVTITYSIRLDKTTAYNTTEKILKSFGGFLTDLDIQFEEDSVQNFPFEERKYLNIIIRHCKVIKHLKIRNFPQTQEAKHSTTHNSFEKFKLHIKAWFGRSNSEEQLLGKIAEMLGKTHFEIEHYPASQTFLSLRKKLMEDTTPEMNFVCFDDMIACVKSVSPEELSRPYSPELTLPRYDQSDNTLIAYNAYNDTSS